MSSNVDDSGDGGGGGMRGGGGGGGGVRSSRPRPIHFPPRQQPLNETPDETEPSYSYEEQSFLAYDREEDVVDEFHRQFTQASSSGGSGSGFGGRHNTQHGHSGGAGRTMGNTSSIPGLGSSSLLRGNMNNNNNNNAVSSVFGDVNPRRNGSSGGIKNNSGISSGGGGGGSNFWRTTSRQTSRGTSTSSSSGSGSGGGRALGGGTGRLRSSDQTTAQQRYVHVDIDVVDNKTSNSNSNSVSKKKNNSNNNNNNNINNINNVNHNNRNIHKMKKILSSGPKMFGATRKPTREAANDNQQHGVHNIISSPKNNQKQLQHQQQQQRSSQSPLVHPFHHSASASSVGSTGSNNNEARLKSKQRDEVRRLKLDAQQQLGEDGGIVDNGYYTEVPTVNSNININRDNNRNRNNGNNNNNNNVHVSSGHNTTMTALEEEMSGDVYTTDDSNDNYDNSVDNDGSHTFLHSNLATTTTTNNNNNNQINATNSSNIHRITTPPSHHHQQQQPTSSSTLLASAADAAAAAVSDYRHYNNGDNNDNSNRGDDNRAHSLTHHINNNIRQQSTSSSSQQQHQNQNQNQNQHQIPVVFAPASPYYYDNTDSRSTTSTLSDLSISENNGHQYHANQHQHHYNSNSNNNNNSSSNTGTMTRGIDRGSSNIGNKANANTFNSLLQGNPVPIRSSSVSSGRLIPHHQQQYGGGGGGGGGNVSDNHNRNISIGSNTPKTEDHTTIATSTTATSIGGGGGRRLQTADYNRHSGGSSSDNANNNAQRSSTNDTQLQNKIALLLDACETIRFPFKKKLILNSLHMTAADIPVKDLYGTVLGQSLYKLSLSGNRLSTVPRKLVTCLPSLKSLDISQCEIHQLPERWNLPQLKRLNLSHNRLTDFPEETMLEGLLELQELNMYGNKVSVIVVPHNPMLLARLEILNLGYNDLAYLPEELDRLKALKTLKVMNNFLEKIPMRVCNMELKTIDVSSNPVIQPPIETCERGIGSMKRYYHCLSMEEQSKPNALEALQSKAARHSRKQAKSKKVGGVGLSLHFSKPKRRMQVSLGRRHSDDSSQSSASKSTPQKLQSSPSSQNRRPIVPDKPSTIAPLIGDDYPKSKSFSTNSDYRASIAMHDPSVSKLPKRSQSLQDPVIEKASTSTRYSPEQNSFTVSSRSELVQEIEPSNVVDDTGRVTINDTLKVIFVGMAMAGKTSMIKRLIEGEDAVIPKRDERTIGVDIYEWDPAIDKRYEHIDNRIQLQDKELEELSGNTNVKFSVWDFAGQHVYHATHELFFSPRALYILVWDMGATNPATKQRIKNADNSLNDHYGAFKLGYDSDNGSSDSDDDDFICEEEARRADRALERDIDEKVQFWVDCIQSSVPGAAILPVASFDDLFEENDHHEAKRRCGILKKRLLKHEARRIQGIKDRLKEYVEQNRANDAPALRLRKLLGSYTRPKIIFGNDGEDSVVRVSGTKYTGFAQLTEKINNIATGRDTAKYRYPIFRGHVGARIPRMRLKVLDAVRRMRDRFKVVEWGYFLEELRKYDITCAENVSDALHFLTNIGELSYFGDVLPDRAQHNLTVQLEKPNTTRLYDAADDSEVLTDDEDDDDVDVTPNDSLFGMNSTVLTVENSSISTDDHLSGGLSQFVFLNPRWLVAAVACILRHDLDREIQETRRTLAVQQQAVRSNSFYEANMNCPVITAEDACMLWQAKRFTKKAAQRAEEYSNEMKLKPFEFLQLLLVRFRVFIPIDLGIEKAFLGGKEYSLQSLDESQTPDVITIGGSASDDKDSFLSTYFFLPSLLGPGEPTEAWTYKSTDSWKATLCHSILFPDGVPPGLMERITASVLSDLYAMAQTKDSGAEPRQLSYEGNITVKEVLCWRTAFIVKLGMQVQSSNGEQKESIVEIFTALVDRDSNVCVGSDQMSVGSMRLVLSGKGQEGDGARKIWMGGYWVVVKAAQRVMEEYGGLEFEKQGFCPECLSKKGVSEASCWDFNFIRRRVLKGDLTIRCRHGHKVDVRLVCPYSSLNRTKSSDTQKGGDIQTEPVVPINDILRSVVVVGLWDGKTRKVVRVGSGFIADKKRGLIVTASHTLMNIWGEKSTPFGENYYGMRQGKVVIGIIPRKKGEESGTEAVFRYFAKIVAKDPEIDQGTCHLDACVLRITTRMENDIGGTGEGCGDQIEHLLLNNPHAIKQEKLQQLKITDKCELDEQVRIVGYNQGGEGLMGPGVNLNRYVDFARGYVCKKFAGGEVSNNDGNGQQQQPVRHRFKPREEIVIICPTIGGHSGGPCINQQGEVIGILSRADPAENQRCYLVPTYEWRSLLRRAKKIL